MGDIDELMGVESDVDLFDLAVEPIQQSRQPLGVRVGARHRQRRARRIAKIVLWIDDQEFETHGGSPGFARTPAAMLWSMWRYAPPSRRWSI